MSSDNRERLIAEVPSNLKQLVDADQRTNRDVVISALKRELGSDETSRLEMQLEHRREQRQMFKKEIQGTQSKVASLNDEISALEDQLETIEDESDSYENALDDVLDEMVDEGTHVFDGHGSIRDIATDHNTDQPVVIDDLKDRADERNLDLSDFRFEQIGRGI